MAGLATARMSGGSEFHAAGLAWEEARQRHVLAGSRSQASMCCCAAGYMNDVFEICRASASVYSVHDRAQFEVNTTVDWQTMSVPIQCSEW